MGLGLGKEASTGKIQVGLYVGEVAYVLDAYEPPREHGDTQKMLADLIHLFEELPIACCSKEGRQVVP